MKYIILLGVIWGMLSLSGCSETSLQQEVTPTVSFADTVVQVFENAGTATLQVNLSSAVPADAGVQIRIKSETNVKEGTDYVLGSQQIHFAKGTTSASLTIDLTDDRIVNQTREFVLELIPGKGIAKDATQGTCRVVLLDDESEAAVFFNQTQSAFLESNDTYYLPLTLEGTPSGTVKVTVETIDSTAKEGEHYTLANKEFIVDENFQGIPITLIDDPEINTERIFTVRIVSTVGAMKITSKSVCTVIIRNDDLGITWGNNKVSAEENPKGAQFRIPIRLQGYTTEDIKIKVAASGGTLENNEYKIENPELIIPSGQDSGTIIITSIYNPEITPDKTLKLQIETVEGHEELAGDICELTVYNYDAQLSLGKSQYKIGENSISTIDLPLSLSQPLKHDVHIKIKENDGFDPTVSELLIPAGSTQQTLTLNLYAERANSLDVEIIPLSGIETRHISSTSLLTVPVVKNSEKTNWSITCDSEETSSNAAKMIDGDENSYWHSRWSTGTDPLPYTIILDMKQQVGLSSIEIFRGPRFDLLGCTMEVSTDQTEWTMLGRLDFPLSKEEPRNGRTLRLTNYAEGRYMRIIVDKTKDTDKNLPAQIAEINIEGWTIE